MRHQLAAAIALATVLAGSTGFAQDKTVVVTFDPGKASKTIKSSITGDAGVSYTLDVKAGQLMQVLFSETPRGGCYFNAFEPGSPDMAVHIGSVAGNEFGASPTKAGTYRFQVYEMRAAARRKQTCRYSISFEVTGDGK